MEAVEVVGAIVVSGFTVTFLAIGSRIAWSILGLGRGGLAGHDKTDVEDIRPRIEDAIDYETEVEPGGTE